MKLRRLFAEKPEKRAKKHRKRAKKLEKKKEYEAAASEYLEAADIFESVPDITEMVYCLLQGGSLLQISGKYEDAISVYENLLEKEKHFLYDYEDDAPKIIQKIAYCYLGLKEFKESEKSFNEAVKLFLKHQNIIKASKCMLMNSYLHLVDGQIEKSKKIVKKVEKQKGREKLPLLQLIKQIFFILKSRKKEKLSEVREHLPEEISKEEKDFFEYLIMQTEYIISTEVNLEVEEKTLRKGDIFSPTIKISTIKPLLLEEIDFNTDSSKLSLLEKLGLEKIPEGESSFKFDLRAEQRGEARIGPIKMKCISENDIKFLLRSNEQTIKILSGYPEITSEAIFSEPIFEDDDLSLVIQLKNNSSELAQNIIVNIDLPPQIRLTKGTPNKTIFELLPNQTTQISFPLQITQSMEKEGEFAEVDLKISFQNLENETKELFSRITVPLSKTPP